VHLLGNVALEVLGKARRDGVLGRAGARTIEGRLEERNCGEREVSAHGEEARVQLSRARMLVQQPPAARCRQDELELTPQPRAGRRHDAGSALDDDEVREGLGRGSSNGRARLVEALLHGHDHVDLLLREATAPFTRL
jgi:hypothetical protein